MIFGEYSDIVGNDILTMQRFLDVSRFLHSRGWQVCIIGTSKLSGLPENRLRVTCNRLTSQGQWNISPSFFF